MNLIKDVRQQIQALDVSPENLRKFALLIGGVVLVFAAYSIWKNGVMPGIVLLSALGISLIGIGVVKPAMLRPIYKGWMTLAFVIGWFVSHFILIIFYYFIFSPVAFILRLSGKQFLDVDFRKKRASYWVPRDSSRPVDYEKMY